MMNLNLNFLPKKDKKKIFTIAMLSWSANIMKVALFFLVLFNCYLFLLKALLAEQVAMLQTRSNEINKNYFFYNQEVSNINSQLDLIAKAASDYSLLTPRFWELINILPNEIQLKNLVLSLDNGNQIIINGSAKNRESLLQYKKILENTNWIISADLPTSQLIQKENLNFNMILQVEPLK